MLLESIVALIFFVLMFLPPVLAGWGIISINWLIGSAIAAYAWSIVAAAKSGSIKEGEPNDWDHHFEKLSADEFDKTEVNIKKGLFLRILTIGAVYGITSAIHSFW